ncbi:MAG: putative hydro-lyase [Candidatus Rokuibacteriota bacterium]|nr:MAG: putative hydro-lyase [Candidatus Rokubacteria bacterium]
MELGTTPKEIRQAIRQGRYTGGTAGFAPGYVQANLVILPLREAYDFLVFCQRNPKPCPLIEVTDPGSPEPVGVAPGADLRSDVPRYRIYRDGRLETEVTDITQEWREDSVAFLLGCSFTFESALLQAGVPVRHIEEGRIVPMFRTRLVCRPAGRFRGPMVVSMRPIPAPLVPRAVTVTARYPMAHGSPLHIGDPARIGIADVHKPDWGEPPTILPGEEPVFWACGVTPQAVALEARLPLVITHAPGHMFITDLPDHALAAL